MDHAGTVFGLTTLAYIIIAQWLIARARKHPVSADHVFWPLDLFRPEHYSPEGNRRRLAAIGFIVAGGAGLAWFYALVS